MQVLRVVPSAARRPFAGRAAAYMSQWASASSLGINHPFVFAVPCTDAPKITVSPSDQKVVENGAVTAVLSGLWSSDPGRVLAPRWTTNHFQSSAIHRRNGLCQLFCSFSVFQDYR